MYIYTHYLYIYYISVNTFICTYNIFPPPPTWLSDIQEITMLPTPHDSATCTHMGLFLDSLIFHLSILLSLFQYHVILAIIIF